jgi:K+-sensing histidine kinase KdpD
VLALGAAVGIGFAFLLEISGHPSWAVLLLIIAAVAPSVLVVLHGNGGRQLTRSHWLKAAAVFAMVAMTVTICLALNFNPRVAFYLPLLVPVLVSAVLFGFATSLFAVAVSIVAADFFFAPPEFDFNITEWEDVLGLAVFGIIGAFAALMIDEFFSLPD